MASGHEFRQPIYHLAEELFPSGDLYGVALGRRTEEDLLRLRQEFGPGTAGRQSFIYIALGAMCEVLGIDDSSRQPICQNCCVGTYDFDIGEVDFMPYCADHEEKGYQILSESLNDAELLGLGKNGLGRA